MLLVDFFFISFKRAFATSKFITRKFVKPRKNIQILDKFIHQTFF